MYWLDIGPESIESDRVSTLGRLFLYARRMRSDAALPIIPVNAAFDRRDDLGDASQRARDDAPPRGAAASGDGARDDLHAHARRSGRDSRRAAPDRRRGGLPR